MEKIFPLPSQHYSVLVRCFTYNQEKYIEDALNGFVMQQTNFPFVCLIVDDASTDKEPEVIKSFLQRECDMKNVEFKEIEEAHIISVHHKKNSNCLMVVYLLKKNLYTQKEKKMALVKPWRDACKYEAMCEGDDYWTDPLKLQKQVDFLENHLEYGMCYSNFSKYNQKNGILTNNCLKKEQVQKYNNLHDWIKLSPYAGPMTWMYRRELMSLKPSFNTVDGSFVTFAFFLAESKVHCLFEDNTAVYRVLENSASHSKDISKQYNYKKGIHDIQLQLIEYYKYKLKNPDELITEINKKYYQRFLFHIIVNSNQLEIEKAINYSDKSWPFTKRLLARCANNILISGLVKRFIKVYLKKNNRIRE